MKDWWMSLRPREQLTLIVGATAVFLTIVYLLAIEPFIKQRDTLTTRIKAEYQQLVWMQQASQHVKQLRDLSASSRTGESTRRSLLSIIDSSARRNKIRKPIQRMEPEGSNGVKLWIENADFDGLIVWLGHLDEKHGISVTRATISQGKTSGLVDTRLSLQRQ